MRFLASPKNLYYTITSIVRLHHHSFTRLKQNRIYYQINHLQYEKIHDIQTNFHPMIVFFKQRMPFILLLSTLLIATFLHLWHLTEFPPAVAGDEAQNGLEVLRLIAQPKLTPFLPANQGRESLFFYMLMLPVMSLGPTVFALRIWPALLGILMVALSFRWIRALLPSSSQSNWVALLASIFIATSLWGLYVSRLGLRGILLLPFMLATYYFFWYGYCHQKFRWFTLSGTFLGLAMYTYLAGRLLPLTLIFFVVVLSIFYRKQETERVLFTWQALLITGLTSIIIATPLAWYFFRHPAAFLVRSSQVTLWESFQVNHAHTGQSFVHFMLISWGNNLRWFVNMATPWVQNKNLPVFLQLIPFFFWIGLIRAVYLARRHVGYSLLLISFFVGLLPILFSSPTVLRVIVALPAAYALLAIGAYYPVEYLLGKLKQWEVPINTTVIGGFLLFSTLASIGLYRFERWVGLPPLPTEFDHAFDIAAKRIRTLVLSEKQRVLVPQAVYGFPSAQFLLQNNFAPPLPVSDKAILARTETISVFWPVNWAKWFEDKPPSFVLLSPGAQNQIGYIESIGQWEQAEFANFEDVVQAQQSSSEIELVIDDTGRPVGHIIKMEREQVFNSLRAVPQNPVHLKFQDEIALLGYDAWFLSGRNLDIGLFWQAQQYIEEDHSILLQLVDRHGQVLGETVHLFRPSTAAWYPKELVIDHQIIRLIEELQPGNYVLKVGLIKVNYKKEASFGPGELMPALNLGSVQLSERIVPIGLIQVGDLPRISHNMNADFGDKISLTGYRLDQGTSPNMFRISLLWQALQPIDKDYTVTIQLLDQELHLVAQVDQPPLGGTYPTTTWTPNLQMPDVYNLQLPDALPGGVYQLAVGVYDLQTLERLSISQTDNTIPGANLVVIQQIVR